VNVIEDNLSLSAQSPVGPVVANRSRLRQAALNKLLLPGHDMQRVSKQEIEEPQQAQAAQGRYLTSSGFFKSLIISI
jgi:hypothetical protein